MEIEEILSSIVVDTNPFSLCELAPRSRLDMPRSQWVSLHYILEGAGTLEMSGHQPLQLSKGDLALIPAAQYHWLTSSQGTYLNHAVCKPAGLGLGSVRQSSSDPDGSQKVGLVVLCAHLTVGFRGAGAIIDLLQVPIVEPLSEDVLSMRGLDLIMVELQEPRLGSRVMIRTLLLEIVLNLLRYRVDANDPTTFWLSALADQKLWPVLKVMLAKPGAAHTVESLAELAGMSRSRFAHRFSENFGATPIELLRRLRLQYAARQLIESDAGLARIAEQSGFLSRSYFSTQFVTAFGMTPSKYRKTAGRKEG
ncbi:MAG: AraC family transcriptional regulator [Hoeflea sp.]|uniref:AraC family transcriptional regulator n=1 Tax=Hoeflea sp. TaxID=1940281 RepID=UPI001D4852C5|nr:AraC family transcriptional regulator [Hoeflea sp.]MBU4530735.1 AraC family transcriptional regulator [Alphaproteobacteria bacterium]MBU4544734.1 AraC family transcriptional regulator [Alphaproteobacteria bacterium]MBU4549290.1 AraC family transcriptional regulator [Alphaproteobacteria bacterium]MBV1726329.1 AraC family transcriptional regulator [Hoeflea sp.]MBV1761671.1 AraC family transcriptional regulator [Hoeflea sp.]